VDGQTTSWTLARSLYLHGVLLALYLDRADDALPLLEKARDLYTQVGDWQRTALVVRAMAQAAHYLGQYDKARGQFEEALELCSDNLFITALLEQGFAELEINVGDLSLARMLAEKSVQTLRELGEFRSLVAPLGALARIELREGCLDDADLLFSECLELSRR